MTESGTVMPRLIRVGGRMYERKLSFLGVFAFFFLGIVVVLAKSDLLPSAPPAEIKPEITLAASALIAASSTASVLAEEPVKIEIKKIGLATTIENPTTTVIAVLNTSLLKGAVRYPTSALLGETGNVVLFGHSSYLPVVGNQAYKAFNGIQKLVAGDVITVYSLDAAHTYRVRGVAKESTNTAGISLAVTGRVLTLSTCDSFGAETDRFVVTADFVESHPLAI